MIESTQNKISVRQLSPQGRDPQMLFRLSLLLLCLVVCRSSNGEIILLKNGGELLGVVSDKQSSDTLLKIRTISGGLLIIPRNQIAQIVPRNRHERAYYTQRDKTPDTIEGHLELALWCSDKDLRQYRRAHQYRLSEKTQTTVKHVSCSATRDIRDNG